MLLRSVLFNIAIYLNFLVQAVLFAPVLVLPERHVWPIARFWVRSTLWLHRIITGIGDEIRGRENIPAGGFLVASKHMSAWETLRLIELFPRPCFILKRQLLWLPLFGWYLWKVGMIPVDRGKGSAAIEAMTARARRAIAEERQIIIFPEGTRRPPLAPPAYRRGLARLYFALGVTCLPIALNSGLFWPRRSFVHNKGTIVAACLPPIPAGIDQEAFAEQVQAQIESASNALIAEALARNPELWSKVFGLASSKDTAPHSVSVDG
jgi:1-acyl-sn-glycerol-3-phosphate acyltransferase